MPHAYHADPPSDDDEENDPNDPPMEPGQAADQFPDDFDDPSEDAKIVARISAYNPRWRLVREGHELVLYGNQAPAAFRCHESCHDWLKRLEKVKLRSAARTTARNLKQRAA